MSEQVTLKSFEGGNDWTSDDGKIALTFYDCVFDRNGADFKAQWGKKQGTGEPTVGESLEGEFYEKGGKQRFRKASKPQGGGGSSDYGSKSNGKSPDVEASIHRQVALKILAHTINDEGLSDWVKSTVREIESFIAASGASVPDSGIRNAPRLTSDIQLRLTVLLEGSVNSLAARLLATWAVDTLPEHKQLDCIKALEGEKKQLIVDWMRSEYQKAHGDLPEASTVSETDEDIPF